MLFFTILITNLGFQQILMTPTTGEKLLVKWRNPGGGRNSNSRRRDKQFSLSDECDEESYSLQIRVKILTKISYFKSFFSLKHAEMIEP